MTFIIIQNDCALVILDRQVMVLQTVLGWLFRQLAGELGEIAAIRYFQRITKFTPSELNTYRNQLQEALGEIYETRYEILLPFIEEKVLLNRTFLAEGRYGRVLSAKWVSASWIGAEQADVVLKYMRTDEGEREKVLTKFLREVCLILNRNIPDQIIGGHHLSSSFRSSFGLHRFLWHYRPTGR